jgi:hypothetical protein
VAQTNHGKFFLMQFGAEEWRYKSKIAQGPLLASLPSMRRFGGGFTPHDLLLVDLQTQEAFFFDPHAGEEQLRQRFLVHPLHVCILFFPVMRVLAAAAKQSAAHVWKLPGMVTVVLDDVLNQPGLLLDSKGVPVRGRLEWSARRPLSARLRNREVLEGDDPELGQGELTPAEARESVGAARLSW